MMNIFLLPLVALILGLTSLRGGSKTDEEFLGCWGGQPAANGMARVQFEAVDYPRSGILSSSAACPGLLLHLQFDNNLPRALRSDSRRSDALSPHGFRGVADVFVVARDGPQRMTVRVHRVIRSELPPSAESRAIVERQEAQPPISRAP